MAQNPVVTITMEDGSVMKAELSTISSALSTRNSTTELFSTV